MWGGSRRRLVRIGAAAAALLAFAAAPGAWAHTDGVAGGDRVRLSVDAGAPTRETVNRGLIGVNWAGELPAAIRPLRIHLSRLDASIEVLFPDGPTLDRAALRRLNDYLDRIFEAGGRPIVILDYMPAWLGDAGAGDPRDRTKLPPRDPALWGRLVREVVTELTEGRVARGRRPVRWFEVWNEPDWPVFYQDRQDRFLSDIFAPSARAVAEVERREGLNLRFGGCACVAPDPFMITPMVAYAREQGLPLDFVSWHWYANTPFLGPEGREPLGSPEQQALIDLIFPVWGQRNPVATPASYGEQIEQVRGWVRAALAGSDRPMPKLIIDEWNLSAGGFDKRMDTHEGAAYDGGVLIEMQEAGLDRGAVFRAVDPAYFADPEVNPSGEELHGGWGLVTLEGTRKPAWWTFRLWRRLAPDAIPSALDSARSDGIWAVPSRGRGRSAGARLSGSRRPASRRLTVLVSSFLAEGAHRHTLALDVFGLAGKRWRLRLWRIDADHPSAERPARRAARARRGRLARELVLPAQSVLLAELRPGKGR